SLDQNFAGGPRVQVAKDLRQRETVLRAEREKDGVLVRRGLQLKAETAAKPLAQREAPGAVDAVAERGVNHELHPAALVEEALQNDSLAGGNGPQRAAAFGEVFGNGADDIGRDAQLAGEILDAAMVVADAADGL